MKNGIVICLVICMRTLIFHMSNSISYPREAMRFSFRVQGAKGVIHAGLLFLEN